MIKQTDDSESPAEHIGRYRLLAPLGQGGMGAIHLALMSGMGGFRKLVVIKELRRDLASNAGFVRLFLAEAKLAGRLNHPNIVQTLEAGQFGDRYYLAMEFLDGQPLDKIVKVAEDEPQFPLKHRLHVLRETLIGLHYAHELRDYNGTPLNIVHCDVSPSNVFVTYDGHVKIVDFGISKASGLTPGGDDGIFKGKLRYAAPEQLIGQGIDRRADIFSVGAMLWEAIALKRFSTGGIQDHGAIERRLTGGEPRIREVVPNVPKALAMICDKALQVNPDDRFSSAQEFCEELTWYLTAEGMVTESRLTGELTMSKFAAERMERHELIYKYTAGDRVTYPNLIHDAATTDGVPTTIADLSELVESTRVRHGVVASTPSGAKTRRKRVWAGGVALGAAIVGLSFATMKRVSNYANAPELANPSEKVAPADALLDVQTAATSAALPKTEGVQATSPPSDQATPASEEDETTAPSRRSKNRQRAANETSSAETARETVSTRQATRPAPSALTSPANSTLQHDGPGRDLRRLKRSQQRGLDEDNPFR